MESVVEEGGLEAIRSPGQALRTARERMGLSLADAARQMRLSARQVEALETDDYGRLPSPIFVRGFIRNYSKLLQIDAEPLLRQAEHAMPAKPASVIVPRPDGVPFPSARGRAWRQYAMVAIVLAISIPFVVYEATRDPQPVKPVAKPVVAVAPATIEQPVVMPIAAAPVTAAESPVNAALQAVPGAMIPAVRGQSGPGRIRLVFDRESWVEIRDGQGQKIFSQLNPAGTMQTVPGVPPFSLVIGNAAGVRLDYNGKTVDLAPHIKVEVARLTLE